MRKETAKRIMDAAYETRNVDQLRSLVRMACESSETLAAIVSEQVEFQHRQDDRLIEIMLPKEQTV